MNILFGCVAYVVLLVVVRHVWPGGILFYQGIFLTLLMPLIQWLVIRSTGYSATPGKDAIITMLATYAFMFTIPTTVDRAYSVRLLVQIEAHSQGMTRTEIQTWFANAFAMEGVERRLQEQMVTGSIEERDGRYQLTGRGQRLVGAFSATQKLFATHSTD